MIPDHALPTGSAADHAAHQYRLAAAALAEMKKLGIAPLPRNYDLWFQYRHGDNVVLVRKVAALLEAEEPFTPEILDALHDEFVAGDDAAPSLAENADMVADAAQGLVRTVTDNQAAVRAYGEMLAHWSQHLSDTPTLAGLVHAVATLSTETARAAARNRELEQQLADSVGRIGKLRQTLADAKLEASTDVLTGIANRRAFDLKLARAVAQQARPAAAPIAVLLLDIDHFKQFNDTYGHKTGDLVLRLMGRVLTDTIKARDAAARYGGEEFAILLRGAALGEGALVAQRIGTAIAALQIIPKGAGRDLERVTVSIGVAQCRPGDTPATLIERADLALYQAKNTGRARVCLEAVPPEPPAA